MNRRPFSRLEKRFLLGSTLGALLLGGFGLKFMGAGTIPPRPPLPNPNGFDLYIAAANAMTRPNPPVDKATDLKIRTPQHIAKYYTAARRDAFVVSNAKSWALMRQARAAQTLHPDVRASALRVLPYQPLRDFARAKAVEAKHFLDLKRPDLALQSGLDTLEMGRDIERGAPLLGSLVGIAIEGIGNGSIRDVPPQLNATQARTGARRLEAIIARGTSPAAALREEKWALLTLAGNNFGQKPNPATKIANLRTPAVIRDAMDGYIAQSQKPYALRAFSEPQRGYFSFFASMLASSPQFYCFSAARRQELEYRLLLRLALRAYRLENGDYPANLDQLTPKYLAKVPRDPFGRGQAMRYRKVGDSYLAWSIGPDGRDDDGVSIKRRGKNKRVITFPESRGDAVIRP